MMVVMLLRHAVHDPGELEDAHHHRHGGRLVFVNIGMWLERFTIVVPSLSNPRAPIHGFCLLAELGRVVADGRLFCGVHAALYGIHEALPDRLDLGTAGGGGGAGAGASGRPRRAGSVMRTLALLASLLLVAAIAAHGAGRGTAPGAALGAGARPPSGGTAG